MKNIQIYKLLVVLALAFYACGEDDAVKLIEPSHRIIVTSEMDFENKINVNDHIDFGDLSLGIESRTWTFPEGVTNIAGSDNNVTSNKDVVKAFFNVAGVYDVKLNQLFKQEAYVDDSKINTGLREHDTTIVVTVYGPIASKLKAYYINEDGSTGSELTVGDNAQNEIIASNSVRLGYETVGGPTNFIWNTEGGKPEQIIDAEEDVDVKYNKLGTFDLEFIAFRNRPTDADTIRIKNFIRVLPSTEPVVVESIKNRDDDIAIEFSREIDPETLNPDDFKVTITNRGSDVPNTIESATLDPNEGNIVILSLLDDGTYFNDVVTVSYTPGSLTSADLVAVTAFIDEPREYITENILEGTDIDYSFENTMDSDWGSPGWDPPYQSYDFTLSDAQAQDGKKSAYIEMYEEGGMIKSANVSEETLATFPVESGKFYQAGMWVYIVEPWFSGTYPTPSNFISDIRFYGVKDTDLPIETIVAPIDAEFPIGEWVYRTSLFRSNTTDNLGFYIRGYNQGANGRLKVYIDNISIGEIALRPR